MICVIENEVMHGIQGDDPLLGLQDLADRPRVDQGRDKLHNFPAHEGRCHVGVCGWCVAPPTNKRVVVGREMHCERASFMCVIGRLLHGLVCLGQEVVLALGPATGHRWRGVSVFSGLGSVQGVI